MKLLLTIAAFLLFMDSMQVFRFWHSTNANVTVLIAEKESEEEKSEENEIKKFDKHGHFYNINLLLPASSRDVYYISHSTLCPSGFRTVLHPPPEVA